MQDNFGHIYQLITSILGVIGGFLIIIYRKKLLQAQKKYLFKRDDFLNKKMFEGITSRPDRSTYFVMIMVGITFIVLSFIQFLKALALL